MRRRFHAMVDGANGVKEGVDSARRQGVRAFGAGGFGRGRGDAAAPRPHSALPGSPPPDLRVARGWRHGARRQLSRRGSWPQDLGRQWTSVATAYERDDGVLRHTGAAAGAAHQWAASSPIPPPSYGVNLIPGHAREDRWQQAPLRYAMPTSRARNLSRRRPPPPSQIPAATNRFRCRMSSRSPPTFSWAP
ncbi:unnamed protein product [Urochloa humidicola]